MHIHYKSSEYNYIQCIIEISKIHKKRVNRNKLYLLTLLKQDSTYYPILIPSTLLSTYPAAITRRKRPKNLRTSNWVPTAFIAEVVTAETSDASTVTPVDVKMYATAVWAKRRTAAQIAIHTTTIVFV